MKPIAFLRIGALGALLIPGAVFAQAPASPGPAPSAPAPAPSASAPAGNQAAAAPPVLDPATAALVTQRIDALKARLAITPAEEAAWDAFAQTMRANAASTDALFAQRVSTAATMTAVENMHSYAAIAWAYADNTQHLSNAFDTLYAALSDEQKHMADTLFRTPPAAEAQKPASR